MLGFFLVRPRPYPKRKLNYKLVVKVMVVIFLPRRKIDNLYYFRGMRNEKCSSLLFLLLPFFFLIHLGNCFAQKKSDSTRYYYNVILHPSKISDLPNAIKYYSKKKEQNLSNKDTLGAISNLRMIAIAQFKVGFFYDSESSVVEALNLINVTNHKDTLIDARVGLYNQLGRIYRTLNNYDKAIETFEKAIGFVNKIKDSITILNNKANIYKDINEYKLALDQYALLYDKVIEQRDSLQLAMILDNLGSVQAKLDSSGALHNLNLALDIRIKKNNLAGMYTSYKNLWSYFLDKNDKKRALVYANEANKVVEQLGEGRYTRDAISLYLKMGDNPYILEYMRLTDSISKARQLAENKNAFMKYNLEEERKKTEASKLQQEKEKRLKLWYQSVAAIILIVLIASFIVFQDRYKRGKIEQIHKTETRISKKVHDEVANDVYHIMTKLQSSPMVNEEVMDDLEDIYIKTRDISKENSALNVKEGFEGLLNDLLVSYKGEKINLVTRNLSKIDWNSISELKKISIYRVLQELMTNMKKHSEASLVALTFERVKKKIVIKYSDNGVGCKVVKNSGLLNVENRIVSLNGTITFESELNKGFKVKITI